MENKDKKIESLEKVMGDTSPDAPNLEEQPEEPKSLKKEIFSWVKLIALAILIAFFINTVIIVNASVPSESMRPTIEEPARLIAFRLSYLFSEPERFDVIVFNSPDDDSRTRYVKRVIGLPGETLEIVNGLIFINGSTEPLDEWYLYEPPASWSLTPHFSVIPEGHFFVLGDNRNNSRDSRGLGMNPWDNLYVPEGNIMGRAIFTYFPRIGMVR